MNPHPSLLLATSLLFVVPRSSLGEADTRSVQEELRRRNVYFGEIDGRSSPELTEATRQYQKRKGLSSTGQADADTMRSLGLLPRRAGEPPPKEPQWPEEPVLRSDAPLDIPAIAQQISRETGVPAATLTGGKPASIPVTRKSRPNRGNSARLASSSTQSPAPSPIARKNDARLDPAEMTRFIRDYLKASSKGDLKQELRYYGDRLQYYRNGWVDRRIVEESLRRYYQRWPHRSYRLGSVLDYSLDRAKGQIVCTFRIDFTLKGRSGTVRGQTDNQFIINSATADPRISSIQERRVRR